MAQRSAIGEILTRKEIRRGPWLFEPSSADSVIRLDDLEVPLQPALRYILLASNGASTVSSGGDAFWSQALRGVWHTARARQTCQRLHIMMGRGTQTRPAEERATPRASV